jgi:subtilisin-like proprotein convertase family protein
MKKNIVRKKSFGSGLLSAGLSFLLIAAMISPAWAVVFTNPGLITLNDATTIGNGFPYSSDIAVSGLTGTITSITVTLNNLNHTFPDDFDILLVGPTGANLILMSDTGGSIDVSGATITFDDAAAASLPDATFLSTGSFKPTNIGAGDTWNAPAPAPSASTTLAAAFAGTAPNGTWNLYVADDLGVDAGGIGNGWSVKITTTSSPATNFVNGGPISGGDGARGRANPYSSSIAVSGLTGAVTNVKVTLTGLNHLNPDDLDILLVSPRGKRILLLSDAGGTADVATTNITFDDAAAAAIPDAGPLVAGSFKPVNYGTGDTIPDLQSPYPNPATAGSATLASVFNGTEPNGNWNLYIVDDATTLAGTITSGWSLDITAGGSYGARRFTSTDFEGDGRSDVSVFRPSDSIWYLRDSRDYFQHYVSFGAAGDKPVPGDYDGDGKTDVAIFRGSGGFWAVLNSSSSTISFIAWGLGTDTPVQADYDGDGKIDVAVRRDSDGFFYVRQSASLAARMVRWGLSGDRPVTGYFEGTNGADFAVYRPSDNNWYILNNAASSSRVMPWGTAGDLLTPADYDGDGKTDIAIFRPSDGNWYVYQSSSASVFIQRWGASGDVPAPGDFDGDSRADLAVWRASEGGAWYINNSGTPLAAAALRFDNWGFTGDSPINNLYLPQ